MILRLVAAIRVLAHVFVVPRDTSAKDCAIALHVAMLLAMPLAFLCVQAVRSIAWRSDQTAKNCFLTLRNLLRKEKLAVEPWKEFVEQWQQRAEKCIRHMNAEYDLQGFCLGFPGRLRKLEDANGERLRF